MQNMAHQCSVQIHSVYVFVLSYVFFYVIWHAYNILLDALASLEFMLESQ